MNNILWFLCQDAGNKRRAILFGIRDYTQDGPFRSLSVSPANDVRDLASVLATGGYAANNVYENLPSSRHFQEVVKVFVQEVNREAEEIGDKIVLVQFLVVVREAEATLCRDPAAVLLRSRRAGPPLRPGQEEPRRRLLGPRRRLPRPGAGGRRRRDAGAGGPTAGRLRRARTPGQEEAHHTGLQD